MSSSNFLPTSSNSAGSIQPNLTLDQLNPAKYESSDEIRDAVQFLCLQYRSFGQNNKIDWAADHIIKNVIAYFVNHFAKESPDFDTINQDILFIIKEIKKPIDDFDFKDIKKLKLLCHIVYQIHAWSMLFSSNNPKTNLLDTNYAEAKTYEEHDVSVNNIFSLADLDCYIRDAKRHKIHIKTNSPEAKALTEIHLNNVEKASYTFHFKLLKNQLEDWNRDDKTLDEISSKLLIVTKQFKSNYETFLTIKQAGIERKDNNVIKTIEPFIKEGEMFLEDANQTYLRSMIEKLKVCPKEDIQTISKQAIDHAEKLIEEMQSSTPTTDEHHFSMYLYHLHSAIGDIHFVNYKRREVIADDSELNETLASSNLSLQYFDSPYIRALKTQQLMIECLEEKDFLPFIEQENYFKPAFNTLDLQSPLDQNTASVAASFHFRILTVLLKIAQKALTEGYYHYAWSLGYKLKDSISHIQRSLKTECSTETFSHFIHPILELLLESALNLNNKTAVFEAFNTLRMLEDLGSRKYGNLNQFVARLVEKDASFLKLLTQAKESIQTAAPVEPAKKTTKKEPIKEKKEDLLKQQKKAEADRIANEKRIAKEKEEKEKEKRLQERENQEKEQYAEKLNQMHDCLTQANACAKAQQWNETIPHCNKFLSIFNTLTFSDQTTREGLKIDALGLLAESYFEKQEPAKAVKQISEAINIAKFSISKDITSKHDELIKRRNKYNGIIDQPNIEVDSEKMAAEAIAKREAEKTAAEIRAKEKAKKAAAADKKPEESPKNNISKKKTAEEREEENRKKNEDRRLALEKQKRIKQDQENKEAQEKAAKAEKKALEKKKQEAIMAKYSQAKSKPQTKIIQTEKPGEPVNSTRSPEKESAEQSPVSTTRVITKQNESTPSPIANPVSPKDPVAVDPSIQKEKKSPDAKDITILKRNKVQDYNKDEMLKEIFKIISKSRLVGIHNFSDRLQDKTGSPVKGIGGLPFAILMRCLSPKKELAKKIPIADADLSLRVKYSATGKLGEQTIPDNRKTVAELLVTENIGGSPIIPVKETSNYVNYKIDDCKRNPEEIKADERDLNADELELDFSLKYITSHPSINLVPPTEATLSFSNKKPEDTTNIWFEYVPNRYLILEDNNNGLFDDCRDHRFAVYEFPDPERSVDATYPLTAYSARFKKTANKCQLAEMYVNNLVDLYDKREWQLYYTARKISNGRSDDCSSDILEMFNYGLADSDIKPILTHLMRTSLLHKCDPFSFDQAATKIVRKQGESYENFIVRAKVVSYNISSTCIAWNIQESTAANLADSLIKFMRGKYSEMAKLGITLDATFLLSLFNSEKVRLINEEASRLKVALAKRPISSQSKPTENKPAPRSINGTPHNPSVVPPVAVPYGQAYQQPVALGQMPFTFVNNFTQAQSGVRAIVQQNPLPRKPRYGDRS